MASPQKWLLPQKIASPRKNVFPPKMASPPKKASPRKNGFSPKNSFSPINGFSPKKWLLTENGFSPEWLLPENGFSPKRASPQKWLLPKNDFSPKDGVSTENGFLQKNLTFLLDLVFWIFSAWLDKYLRRRMSRWKQTCLLCNQHFICDKIRGDKSHKVEGFFRWNFGQKLWWIIYLLFISFKDFGIIITI